MPAEYTPLYREAQEKLDRMKKAVVELGKMAFKEGCNEVFARFPLLTSFSWLQYTNDEGDVRQFVPWIDDCWINGQEFWDFPQEERMALMPAFNGVFDYLRIFETEEFKDFFGDDKKVTVHRDRPDIEVEHYDH